MSSNPTKTIGIVEMRGYTEKMDRDDDNRTERLKAIRSA
jgi:hypothetical protein